MPVLMVGLMVAPALIMALSTPSEKQIAVVDQSGEIASSLQNQSSISFIDFSPASDIKTLEEDEEFYGILIIGKDIVDNPSDITFRIHEAASIEVESVISRQVSERIENIRLANRGYDNLREVLADVEADVTIVSQKIGEEASTSSMLSYALGFIMTFILYMFLLIYGQMVIDRKSVV